MWHVSDSDLSFVHHKSEWNGTDTVFEVSEKEGNLRMLINTGKNQPDAFA